MSRSFPRDGPVHRICHDRMFGPPRWCRPLTGSHHPVDVLLAVLVRALVLCVDFVLDLVADVVDPVLALLDLLVGRAAVAVLVFPAGGDPGQGERGANDTAAARRFMKRTSSSGARLTLE